jgi:uncharacterized OB-fold protein
MNQKNVSYSMTCWKCGKKGPNTMYCLHCGTEQKSAAELFGEGQKILKERQK